MNWNNLHQFRCPYCDNDLQKRESEIGCTSCFFHIGHQKFADILESHKQKPTVKMIVKWQNLNYGLCPYCNNFLMPNPEGNQRFLKCINHECTFKMSEVRVGEILQDQTHPANTYFQNKTHE